MPKPPPNQAAPGRRLRLSVRGLLILVALVAIPLGWKVRRAGVQRRAVAAVHRLGGRVLYDWQVDPSATFHGLGMLERYEAKPPGPRWLRGWLGDEYFQEVVAVKVWGLSTAGLPGMPPPPPGGRPEWAGLSDQQVMMKRRQEFVTADRLACLEGFDRVRWLEMGYFDLDPVGLERLARMTSVESLALNLKSDRGLLGAMARLPGLRDLETGTVGEDGGPPLPHLRTLRLTGTPGPGSLAWLRRHPDVTDLSFRVMPVDDAVLAGLRGMTHLARLDAFDASPVTDAGLAGLVGLDELRGLDLSGVKNITDEGLAHLALLPRLEVLELCNPGDDSDRITDEGLAHLAAMPRLRSVCLSMARRVTDEGLAHLGRSPSLRSIGLPSATGITDAGLAHLSGLKDLETLINFKSAGVTDAGLAHLSGLKKLKRLDFESSPAITDAGLAHLSGLNDLEHLNLDSATGVTDAGLASLAKLPRLSFVRLGKSRVTAAGLAALKAARRDLVDRVEVNAEPRPPGDGRP